MIFIIVLVVKIKLRGLKMLKLVKFFIDKPKVTNLIMVFLFLAGIIALINVQKEGYPSIDFGTVLISTSYPGASPLDVELKVTNKIEEKLKEVSGIKEIKSWSMESFSSISIKMEDKVDTAKVNEDIKNAVDQVTDFPDDVKKPVVTLIIADSFPMFEIALTGSANYKEIREHALALEKILERNKYVGQVNKIGYLDREVKIEVDQKKLHDNYISLGELMTAIQNQNFRMSSGDFIADNEKKIVVMSEFKKLTDVGKVIVRSGYDGKRVVVSDVAKINDSYEKPDKIVRYNGQNAINLVIVKKSNTDIIKASKSVEKIINDYQEKLPDDIKLKMIVDYSVETKSLLKLVIDNSWIGFILVVIVLLLLLNWRLAFWTSMGIPTSIFIAFLLFPIFGITINFISLMAIIIVLGMLVDDAIIIGENIFRYREQGIPAMNAAYLGVKEVMWPVITTIMTTIIVFLPMAFMSGMMGKFMRIMPIVVILMLGASLIEALIILPSHVAHLKYKNKRSFMMKIFHKFENFYEKVIRVTLKHKYKTILVFVAAFAVSIFLLASPAMKFILFPSNDGYYGVVKYETEKGTSLRETANRVKEIEKILSEMDKSELSGFVTIVGQQSSNLENFDEGNVNNSFLGNITLYFTSMSSRDRTSSEIIKELKEKLKSVKGFKKIETEIVEDGPPTGKPVTITFVHNNDSERNKITNELKNFLSKQEGVYNIVDNQGEGKKQLTISFDYNKMSRLGLDPLNVSNIIRAAFEGNVVTSLRWNGEDVDYRVILNEDSRRSLKTLTSSTIKNIKSLTVNNQQGKLIPLGQFITLEEKNDLMMINHFGGDKSITVYADIDTEILTSKEINDKIKAEFLPKVDKIAGMSMIAGGEEQETVESLISFAIAFVLAILGVYFILVILFNSFTQPFLVMLTIPFGFAGVVFAFFLNQMPFSFSALIGMIGLTGVVVNDSLVMITFLNNKRKSGDLSIDGLANAARHRLRPIVLTTLTTAAGLFPSAYGFGGNNPFIIPMIMAIAWGLVFATVITLILLPSLYLAQIKIDQRIRKLFKLSDKSHTETSSVPVSLGTTPVDATAKLVFDENNFHLESPVEVESYINKKRRKGKVVVKMETNKQSK